MKQSLTKLLLTLLLTLALLLVACTDFSAGSHRKGHFTDRTDMEVYTYQVQKTADSARLHLQMRLTAGSVAWVFLDPNGTVRWNGEATPGRGVDEEQSFGPIVGKWTLRLVLENATGDYDVYWTAR